MATECGRESWVQWLCLIEKKKKKKEGGKEGEEKEEEEEDEGEEWTKAAGVADEKN